MVTPQAQPQVAIVPNTPASSHTGSSGHAVPRGLDLNRSFEDKKRVRVNPVPEIVMLDPSTDEGCTGSFMLPAAPSSHVPVPIPAMPSGTPAMLPSGSVNGDIAVQPASFTVTLPIQEVIEAITIPNTIMNRNRSRSKSPKNTSKEEAKKW